jgi:hypothetical protein
MIQRRQFEISLINQSLVVDRLVSSRVMELMIVAATLRGK